MKKISVLGVNIDCLTSQELEKILKEKRGQIRVAKVNAEFLFRALENPEFKKTINDFELVITDGVGVLWAAKFLSLPLVKTPFIKAIQSLFQVVISGASLVFYPKYVLTPIPERFSGVEAFEAMLGIAVEKQKKVYLFGGEINMLKTAVKNLKEKFPQLHLAGFYTGYDYKNDKVLADIKASKADWLFVNLGSPKQEHWIKYNLPRLKNIELAVGEGGTFDFVAGDYKRAPKWMRVIGLEWLWRLFINKNKTGELGKRSKSRLGRIWQAVPGLIIKTYFYKLKNGAI